MFFLSNSWVCSNHVDRGTDGNKRSKVRGMDTPRRLENGVSHAQQHAEKRHFLNILLLSEGADGFAPVRMTSSAAMAQDAGRTSSRQAEPSSPTDCTACAGFPDACRRCCYGYRKTGCSKFMPANLCYNNIKAMMAMVCRKR